MTTLTFSITFHGPFAVSSGYPDDGVDHTVDPTNPLPQTQIRGLLRAHAESWLHVKKTLVAAVFGTAATASPWVFGQPKITQMARQHHGTADPWVWNRVQVDGTGRSEDNALLVGQQTWASSGTFEVLWNGRGEAPQEHILVLRAAARDIVSIGLNRRRGMGTVTITDPTPWTAEDTKALLTLGRTA